MLPLLFAVLLPSFSLAQIPTGPRAMPVDKIEWKSPGSLPPGAEFHALYEDKTTKAVETLVRFKAGYVLPEHRHTQDEVLVVTKGKLAITMNGEETVLSPGAYAVIPGGTPHSFKVKGMGRCEFVVTMSGPFDILGLSPVK